MSPTVKLRGAGLLKVVSIILIIFGAISIVSGFTSIGSGSMMANMFGLDETGVKYFSAVGMISIIAGAAELVFGVLGVKFCNRADKAGFLLIVGIIQIVITVFTTLYNKALAPMADRVNQQILDATAAMYGVNAESALPNASLLTNDFVITAIGFILPVLFVIGALLNRKEPKTVVPAYTAPTYTAPPLQQPESQYTQQPEAAIAQQPDVAIAHQPEAAVIQQPNVTDVPQEPELSDEEKQKLFEAAGQEPTENQ